MTAEEFNALPLSARQFIEKQQGCLSCGSSQDIDSLYKKYLTMKNKALFTLRTGAVPYQTEDGKGGVLYPIQPKDTEEVIKGKLKEALIVYALRPGKFSDFDEDKIKAILAAEPAEPEVKQLHGAAKKAAEAKAAKEAAESDLD
jgi:hypothetical protein